MPTVCLTETLTISNADNPQDKWLAYDSIADVGFGQKLRLLEQEELRFILDIFELYTYTIGLYEQWPELAALRLERLLLMKPHIRNIARKFRSWRESFTRTVLDDNGKGLFFHIVQSQRAVKAGPNYSEARVNAEGSTLLLIGKCGSP